MIITPKFKSANIRNGALLIDSHGSDDGYIFAASGTKTDKKLKLRIAKDQKLLNYDLNNTGEYDIFPLQLGNGRYQIILYENVLGKEYKSIGSASLYAKLKSDNAPFLIPNQYVNYDESSDFVKVADALCDGIGKAESFYKICNYIKTHFQYDYVKAVTVKAGVLPNIKDAIKKHMGICQDLSALTVAMLRSQGIPAILEIGYADRQYHAWVKADIDGKKVLFDPTKEITMSVPVKRYRVEREY